MLGAKANSFFTLRRALKAKYINKKARLERDGPFCVVSDQENALWRVATYGVLASVLRVIWKVPLLTTCKRNW